MKHNTQCYARRRLVGRHFVKPTGKEVNIPACLECNTIPIVLHQVFCFAVKRVVFTFISPFYFSLLFFLFFCDRKEKEKEQKKEKTRGCFLCPDGHWAHLAFNLQGQAGKPALLRSLSMLTHHVRGVRIVIYCVQSTNSAHPLSTGEGQGGG